ncbi:MAG: hypothetical protein IE880_05630, partial [Epsilonproteobacteria bacterium]|nr:hypothetical protein [Campylobacterota bacterium]
FNDFENNQDKFEKIQKTNKALIKQDGKTTGFITALYDNDTKYEKFLVGIYAEEDLKKLQFLLDGNNALRVEELQNSDKRLDKIPLKNRWSRYFELTFVKSDLNIIKLQIVNGQFWKKEIVFSKIPNYLNSKDNNIF